MIQKVYAGVLENFHFFQIYCRPKFQILSEIAIFHDCFLTLSPYCIQSFEIQCFPLERSFKYGPQQIFALSPQKAAEDGKHDLAVKFLL